MGLQTFLGKLTRAGAHLLLFVICVARQNVHVAQTHSDFKMRLLYRAYLKHEDFILRESDLLNPVRMLDG